MYEFENNSCPQMAAIVMSQAIERSAEQEQRDVFESQRHHIFALAYYMTGNEIEAEEILSSTFVQAFRQSNRPDALTVDSVLIGELRGRFSLAQNEPVAIAQDTVAEDRNVRNVRRTDLEEALQNLPANERLLFLLREVEGYSVDVIAGLLEIPQPEVQRSLFSARIRLCQALASSKRSSSAAA